MPWRIRAFLNWLVVDPLAFWSAIGLPVVVLVACRRVSFPGDVGVRSAGYILTLAGAFLVARGVLETQRLFERPRYLDRVHAWLKRFTIPFKRRSVIAAASSVTLGISGNATATLIRANKKRSVSERLRLLEQDVKRLETLVDASVARVANDVAQLRAKIETERNQRSEELERVRKLLVQFSAGSLDWEVVGLVWLVVGQALAYFPGEIAEILRSASRA